MEPALDRIFLDASVKKLRQLCDRIERSVARLNEDQVWARGTDNENAIGNLLLHLNGNVRQWILSGVGGQPDTRQRDLEFSARGDIGTQEMLARLRDAIEQAVGVIEGLTPERLVEVVRIQRYDVTRMDAVFHVVEHFSQHTGQILFATKMLTGEDLGFYAHLKAAGHSEKTP